AQPVFIWLRERRADTIDAAADNIEGALLGFGSCDPARGEADQIGPVAFEEKLQFHADDAVIEVIYAAGKLLAARRADGFAILDDGWTLEADVFGRGVFKARLAARRFHTKNRAEFFQIDLLGDIVERQHPKGAAQRGHGLL